MPDITSVLAFALIGFGLVLTPGPNMIYLVPRSICQGRGAGLVSLSGVLTGVFFYMLCAAFGVTALLMAVPFAYDALRFGGAIYLLHLAWQALKPGGRSAFEVRVLATDSPRRLYGMGLLTALLNPKVAVLYLSLLPQFVHPGRGSVFVQSLVLGLTQISVSAVTNAGIVIAAGGIAAFLAGRPGWMAAQRWVMGTVLVGLALRMAAEARR